MMVANYIRSLNKTVLVSLSALVMIGLLVPAARRMSERQVNAISNGAFGAAFGFLVGVGIQRRMR